MKSDYTSVTNNEAADFAQNFLISKLISRKLTTTPQEAVSQS